jgi:diguanylate cyclase (GGDEF)-like protein/PAS domain S-box-containing protein
MRRVQAVLVVLLALAASAPSALALKAIDITNDTDKIEITALGEAHEGRDVLQIETAPGSDGVTQRWSVPAATPGTSPSWFVFALRNTTDKVIERWLTADRFSAAGSGVIWPDLDARRIERVMPSVGYVPERIKNDRADVFRISLEPGQTVTLAAEIAGDRFARLFLWKALEYEQKGRDRQLFNGIMLGITGLLAIFLSTVFLANHKAIFPSAAIFTWCVLAYLSVDFGFYQKLFSVRPEENAMYRAATEAGMAASLLAFLHTFLRLAAWRGFVRMLLGLWIAAQLALVAIAFVDPRLAATFARLSAVAIAIVGAQLTLFLALRGQDRALSLVPTWLLLLVWLFGAGATFTGRLSGDFVVYALTAGLGVLVLLIGFTVTQYAFRSIEPTYGAQPGEQQLRSLAVEGAGAAVWEWSARRDEIKVSGTVESILGLKAGELSAKTEDFAKHMHPTDAERFKLLLWSVKERAGGEVRIDFRMRHMDNSYRWFDLDAASVPGGDARAVRCVGLMREVTDAKRAQDRLLHDAVYDSLTGQPNRELFLDRLAIAAKRATLEPLVRPALMFIDIDRFKSVNRRFGLVVGDSLLLTVARRLGRNLGPQDTLARVGADQFALLLMSQSDPRELAMLAEQVRRSLRSPIQIAGQEISLTASIGITLYDAPDEDPAELLHEAEIAMYRAKRAGADRIEIFRAEMRADKDGKPALGDELKRALERQQLKLVYQPIYYLPTETLAGFEALLRWDHPRLGTLNAANFVPLAEDSDAIFKLGAFVLARAVHEAQRWQQELVRPDAPLFVSINVASRQLFRLDLVNEVRHVLARAVLPKGSLRLEIAEALLMENPERATPILSQLATAGAGIALDDFGTGYSSLSYLNQFSFDTIKLDRSFIQAGGQPNGQSGPGSLILRSVVALAHELGKKVVAEGVENDDDVAFLRSIGCEYGQGYYYGEPMSERDLAQLLRNERKAERRRRKSSLFGKRIRLPEAAAESAEAAAPAAAAWPQRPLPRAAQGPLAPAGLASPAGPRPVVPARAPASPTRGRAWPFQPLQAPGPRAPSPRPVGPGPGFPARQPAAATLAQPPLPAAPNADPNAPTQGATKSGTRTAAARARERPAQAASQDASAPVAPFSPRAGQGKRPPPLPGAAPAGNGAAPLSELPSNPLKPEAPAHPAEPAAATPAGKPASAAAPLPGLPALSRRQASGRPGPPPLPRAQPVAEPTGGEAKAEPAAPAAATAAPRAPRRVADLSRLPPAIAESLARLAGRAPDATAGTRPPAPAEDEKGNT